MLQWIVEARRAHGAQPREQPGESQEPGAAVDAGAATLGRPTHVLRQVVRMCLRGDVAPPLLDSSVSALLGAFAQSAAPGSEPPQQLSRLRRAVAAHGWIGSRFRRPLLAPQLEQLANDLANAVGNGPTSDASASASDMESAVASLLMDEHTRREGQLAWWSTHC